MFVKREGYVCWGRGNALLGGMFCRVERECPVGRRKCSVWREGNLRRGEGNVLSGGRKSPSGKSVSPVSALEGYLGGVVGESEAKRGCESPAPPHGVACGG